jgi:hypothetical protein
MAIGWLSVLKGVPWGDVISNAPKVADGAKKLWSSVSRKTAGTEAPASAGPSGADPAPQTIDELRARIDTLESAAAGLHEQMLASSGLIKSLAEQNAQLIEGVAANRVRLGWLAAALAVVAVLAIAGLALALKY